MPRPNISTVDQFEAYLEARPSRLACWRLGSRARHGVISWLQTESICEQRDLALSVGPGESTTKAATAHHNQVGIAVGWVSRHMTGLGRQREVRDQDLFALRKTAADYWILQNALAEVRAGVREFEVTGTRVRLPYRGNHEVDALDRLLDIVQGIETISKVPNQPMPGVREWMYGEGLSQPWSTTPEWVKQAFRDQASELLALYPRYVPVDFDVVGVLGSELDAFWCELLAWGMQMHAATMLGSSDAPTIAPLVPRGEFVDHMAKATGVSRSVMELIVELLTLDGARCKDCALTPLFPIDGSLLPLVSLIIPASPHRNFLAILQLRPDLYGKVGRMLGRAGERTTVELLGRMQPEVRIGTRINVQRSDGTRAGDFDVVAFDPRTSAGVVLEIQWRLGADGNAEVYKAEQAAIRKRSQVTRLRDEILSGGAVPEWPATWPDMTHCNLRWFVLTHDVLATREVDHDGVTIRSYQLLSRTLRAGASLADLVSALDSPPAPPPELCKTRWERIHYGDLRVDMEFIVA